MNDPQQRRIYDAEESVFVNDRAFIRRFTTLADVRRYVNRVVGSEWWYDLDGPDWVDVEFTPGGSYAGAARVGSPEEGATLWLPGWAWARSLVLHELTHLVTWKAQPHGIAFAGRLLEAHDLFGSRREAQALQDAFDEMGVRYR